jgi:prepilin-type N-terminal cleavage/methylation domain-containing protein
VKITFSDGFSLIELAIVLTIIGFLMGFLLIPISAKKDQQHIESTQKTLEEIKEALLGFAVDPIYKIDTGSSFLPPRIPCPAKYGEYGLGHPKDEVGREDISFCGEEGFLPWKDLKVERYDVWGNPFRYRAAAAFGTTDISVGINPTDISSNLRVRNRLDNIDWTTTSEDSRVAAIIFSYGRNHEADTDNDGTLTYVHDGYDPENDFDDILTWLSRNTLMNRLTTAKKWPPEPDP